MSKKLEAKPYVYKCTHTYWKERKAKENANV